MARIPTMEDELIKCPELKLEDVQALREWASKQPHLPNIDDIPDVFLSLFLRRRYYSLERAKQTLDEFLTFRAHHADIFCDRHTKGPEADHYSESHLGGPLAKRDAEGNVVFWLSMRHDDPSKYNFDSSMRAWTMVADAWAAENGSANGVTLVMDAKNYTMGHMLRISPATVHKMSYFNKHCAPLSLKNIYGLNATPLCHKMLSYFQPILDSQMYGMIKLFSSSQMEEFFKCIPKDQVPKEFGGDGVSMEDLTETTREMVLRQEETFLAKLDSLRVDETKRIGPSNNMNTIFGLEGTFKKLNVD